jgi:hypothetical protein
LKTYIKLLQRQSTQMTATASHGLCTADQVTNWHIMYQTKQQLEAAEAQLAQCKRAFIQLTL